jgi:phosphoserine phosphatase
VKGLIAIFDVEGVLVDGEFLPELAKLVGKEREVAEITLKGIRGELVWEEGLRIRMGLLRGISYEDCFHVANSIPLMKGAREMTRELRRAGFLVVGVSGGFSLLAERVKSELGLDHIFSNQLVFHEGRLIGYGLLVNANKAQILGTAFGEMLASSRKAAVVDGANDLDLFGLADLKIAFNAQPVVKSRADIVIDTKDLSLVAEAVIGRLGGASPARASA